MRKLDVPRRLRQVPGLEVLEIVHAGVGTERVRLVRLVQRRHARAEGEHVRLQLLALCGGALRASGGGVLLVMVRAPPTDEIHKVPDEGLCGLSSNRPSQSKQKSIFLQYKEGDKNEFNLALDAELGGKTNDGRRAENMNDARKEKRRTTPPEECQAAIGRKAVDVGGARDKNERSRDGQRIKCIRNKSRRRRWAYREALEKFAWLHIRMAFTAASSEKLERYSIDAFRRVLAYNSDSQQAFKTPQAYTGTH
ncbi:hypothetical protein C8R44DRAFT_856829 [Mycena epipterygia]|nr:hypothetical protein C8R44DRAFT_856829 [Mycena epipterygia]